MTGVDSQNLNKSGTAQKLNKIKEFLVFAFAKKQSKVAKVVRNELLNRQIFMKILFGGSD